MSEEFNKRWRVVLDDCLSESHRYNICTMLQNTQGLIPNMDDIRKALEFPGMTIIIHVAVTDRDILSMLQDLNDYDYLLLKEG